MFPCGVKKITVIGKETRLRMCARLSAVTVQFKYMRTACGYMLKGLAKVVALLSDVLLQ
jgi:hypothetical protein